MPRAAGAAPGEFRLHILAGLLFLSELGYVALLRLDAVNGVRPVVIFMAVITGLFGCYAAAIWVVRRIQSRQKGALLLVAAGAVFFRLTLLGAGLPHGPIKGGLTREIRTDLCGRAVAYERFLIFDDDIWRYLWDGHVWSSGVNPYRYAPDDSGWTAWRVVPQSGARFEATSTIPQRRRFIRHSLNGSLARRTGLRRGAFS